MITTPLVLIHGYPFDHTLWDPIVERLKGKVRLIVPDLPGFGRTPVSSAEPSIDRMGDYIADLLAKQNCESAVIAGMSMGGYVALSFAEKHPAKLAALGLISTHAWADSEEVKKARREM